MKYDYGAVRTALLQAISSLEDARLRAGRTNLYPTLSPLDARRQIEDVEDALRRAQAEVEAARATCAALARRGLRLADEPA